MATKRHSPPPSYKTSGTARRLSVTDGRVALGTVEMVDDKFIAIGLDGRVIVRFGTLLLAVRALPNKEARHGR